MNRFANKVKYAVLDGNIATVFQNESERNSCNRSTLLRIATVTRGISISVNRCLQSIFTFRFLFKRHGINLNFLFFLPFTSQELLNLTNKYKKWQVTSNNHCFIYDFEKSFFLQCAIKVDQQVIF